MAAPLNLVPLNRVPDTAQKGVFPTRRHLKTKDMQDEGEPLEWN